ncbi:MAG: DUF1579 domain-containing protein [Phycisphaerales bacterium]|nr:DUF1579 domain-containing protein [Phycisphaerales bacterium]
MKPTPFLAALALALACCGGALAQNETTKPSLAPAKRLQSPKSAPKPVQPSKQPGEPGELPKAPGNAPEMTPEMAAAMAAMEAAGRPGEHHQHLAALVGEWDAVTRFRMAEQAPWSESKGHSRNRMDMDGRYLVSEYAGDMAGAPFTGISTWGYDNAAKEYQATWRDSLSTGLMWLRGSCDDAGKVFTLSGDCVDPATGQRKSYRQVTTIKSPDSHTMEFFDIAPDGKSYKNMEIIYTRAGLIPARTKAPTPAPTQPTQNKR